jgi:predicted transcriptional regulator
VAGSPTVAHQAVPEACDRGERRVAEVLLSLPTLHDRRATVGEIRRFLLDDHVHMALVVEQAQLLAAIESEDLDAGLPDETPACSIGSLDGRTICRDARLSEALELMHRRGRRRLAVTTEQGDVVGLLCRKASGLGFCSDEDVRRRRQSLPQADGAGR